MECIFTCVVADHLGVAARAIVHSAHPSARGLRGGHGPSPLRGGAGGAAALPLLLRTTQVCVLLYRTVVFFFGYFLLYRTVVHCTCAASANSGVCLIVPYCSFFFAVIFYCTVQ